MTVISGLTEQIYSDRDIMALFSGTGIIRRMLEVEAALARAEGHCGVIPASAALCIHDVCHVGDVDGMLDLAAIADASIAAGNIAIPFVKQLTAAVHRVDPEAARYVHWGATSQDILDTALVLQIRQVASQLDQDLLAATEACARLTAVHRDTIMVGRTWLQHALPTTFGAKTAGWLQALERSRLRLRQDGIQVAQLQFGGAAGTLASLGTSAPAVSQALAAELGLALPAMPWHSHRDRLADIAATLGVLTGTLGKIARDISLMAQTEVRELAEPGGPGRGGSSTMPHKRNPVGCAAILAAATRVPPLVSTILSAMIQEHERALGGWQAEWDVLPQIASLTGGALRHLVGILDGLDVHPLRMKENLDATKGLILAEAYALALGSHIGRLQAHELVEQATKEAIRNDCSLPVSIRAALSVDPLMRDLFSDEEIEQLGKPENYVGAASSICDTVLAHWKQSVGT
ncbi:3-carboxy-cis,cis-muconate cycloisomerase [Achromobacter seleniivolatilans]|uniref:3-carboxy-cis,cis-muconate cycloisomerase n=1 Tax=Achromobacter seleniivolatilans TaxID=3047478 RepID=A0ABY9M573_9BURK|nr:3-carboxy-cis,cis-muconate cycloisomerase [Achromobacter sp. R39]WMD22162.1 3-carboxy-cis,cis-muconate cycloisomerase [Achromobacter sp. R39]